MAKKLQLLRNQTIFDTKALALTGLSTQLKKMSAGEPAIASYTDGDNKSILLGIALDADNYQIFEGAKIGGDGNLEIPQEVKDAIKEAVDGVIGGASEGYNTLKKIEDLMKAQDTKISGLQSEIDTTQAGAGLGEGGSYSADASTKYISGATSLKDADSKLDAAIKAVEENAIKVAAGDGINVAVNETGHTATVSVKVDAADKVLTVGGDGIKANINLTWSSSDGLKLIGKGGEAIATIPATDFIKDGMLQQVELVVLSEGTGANPQGLTDGTYLKFTFNTDAGSKEIYVNVTSLIDVYTAGNGIDVSGKTISVKRDASSESFLTVGADGVKLSGVQDAINTAKTTIDAYTVNGKAISTNPTLTGGDITLSGYTRSELTNGKLQIATGDTVNVAFGKLEKAILDNEEVCSNSFDAIATAVGLNREGLAYQAPTGTTYVSGATSVQDADTKLDKAIKAVSDKIDAEVSKDCLVSVEAGNGITVTPKAASKQTISANVKADDPIIEVTAEGIKTKDAAVWDCGTY